MRQEIITSLICSACVGLVTLAGTVLISQERIETLRRASQEIKQELEKQSDQIVSLEKDILRLTYSLPEESLQKIIDLSENERNLLLSSLEDEKLNFNENASSQELLNDEELSPQLKEIIINNQLTGNDLKNYSSALENIPQEQMQMIFENSSIEK